MSDHNRDTLSIQSSVLVAGLALVPGNTARYICLGLVLALLVYHVASGQTAAAKMNTLAAAIASANENSARAPSTSASDRVSSMRQELLLRIAEKLKSQLQCQLLEIESHGWKQYFQDVRGLLKGIDNCMKDIKRIQTNIQLLIEQDTQRKLDDEIQKCRAMLVAIHAGPRVTYVSVLSRGPHSFSLNSIRLRAPGDWDIQASCKHFRCVIQNQFRGEMPWNGGVDWISKCNGTVCGQTIIVTVSAIKEHCKPVGTCMNICFRRGSQPASTAEPSRWWTPIDNIDLHVQAFGLRRTATGPLSQQLTHVQRHDVITSSSTGDRVPVTGR
ncbi:hypothetical protein GGX14DRAFT_405031 [Mycena pura]|uniref:Uncharacterized protein n=1 Tax=Mycena pura TaxID=153505 RepID=A0AAD6UT57_9AGAR|nr:hypothetical protein GGX14DRAFT_405031 [Mycena pura]